MNTGEMFGAMLIALWMLASLIMIGHIVVRLTTIFFACVRSKRRKHIEDQIDHDEWKYGSPERYLPPDAKPVLFEEGDE